MAGILYSYVINSDWSVIDPLFSLSTNSILGPYINIPELFSKNAIRIYKLKLNRNLIGIENRDRTVIYSWINLINGKSYVGSVWKGSTRILSY